MVYCFLKIYLYSKQSRSSCRRFLPKFEIRIDHPVGETFTANTDTFKYTVTGQLVHYQVGVDDT